MTEDENYDRRMLAKSWTCPDCGENLVECEATDVHPFHRSDEKGRKCVNCEFSCYFGDDN